MNFFRASIHDDRLDAASFTLPLPLAHRTGGRVTNGQQVQVGVRPENLLPSHEQGRGATARVQAIVDLVEPIGHQAIVHSRLGEDLFVAAFDSHNMPKVGEAIDLIVEFDALHLFDATSEKRL